MPGFWENYSFAGKDLGGLDRLHEKNSSFASQIGRERDVAFRNVMGPLSRDLHWEMIYRPIAAFVCLFVLCLQFYKTHYKDLWISSVFLFKWNNHKSRYPLLCNISFLELRETESCNATKVVTAVSNSFIFQDDANYILFFFPASISVGKEPFHFSVICMEASIAMLKGGKSGSEIVSTLFICWFPPSQKFYLSQLCYLPYLS